jgi:hypothetical protein
VDFQVVAVSEDGRCGLFFTEQPQDRMLAAASVKALRWRSAL